MYNYDMERHSNDKYILDRIGQLKVTIAGSGDVLATIPMVLRPSDTMGSILCAFVKISETDSCIFVNKTAIFTQELEDYIALSALQCLVDNEIIAQDMVKGIPSIALITMIKGYTQERAIGIMNNIINTDCVDLIGILEEMKMTTKIWLCGIMNEFLEYEDGDNDAFFNGVTDNFIPLEIKIEMDINKPDPVS